MGGAQQEEEEEELVRLAQKIHFAQQFSHHIDQLRAQWQRGAVHL